MKRILIICNQFIPYVNSIGGTIRILSLANFLKLNQVEVYILCKKNEFYNYYGYKNYLKGLNCYFIESSKTTNGISKTIKKKRSKFLYNFKEYLNCYGIDNTLIDLPNYLKISKEIIQKHNIDNVFISAPPNSLFIIGYLLKRKLNINLIHDYRDNWNLRFKNHKNIIYFLPKKIENFIINKCDNVLASTQTIKSSLKEYYSVNNIILFRNGFEKKLTNKNKKKINKKINIGYFGEYNDTEGSFRNISIISRAIENKPILKDKFIFHFYGASKIENHNLEKIKYFKFNNSIDHVKALKKMQTMDFLLIIHTEEKTVKEVITGKFYDYITTEIPIICITSGNSEVGNIIKKNKFGIVINYLEQNLIEKLRFLKKIELSKLSQKKIMEYSRKKQNIKVLRIIK